jgi:Secretion system C-terminal sorting domain
MLKTSTMSKKLLQNALLLSFFLFLANVSRSQQTLSQIGGWNAYVHLPANYALTTINYPTIIFFPGLGEVGTNPAALISNGPGAYITQGWNGNVLINSNTVEFIVISIQPPSAYPNEIQINQKIQLIKSAYRVDNNRLYLTGLSHGGWCSTTFVTGDAYGGPYTYASQIAAVVEVQGVIPDDNSPYPNLFDNFAATGGKLLGFEQRLDNRGVPTRVNRMNSTVPNSAIYMQTNFGGGGHCCWNQFYGGQGTTPGNFVLGGVSQNLYQWLARQARVNMPPVVNAGIDVTVLPPMSSTSLNGTASDPDGTIASYLWTKISGPATGILTNAANAQASVSSLVQGNYQYEFKVTDNAGAVSKDTLGVTVGSIVLALDDNQTVSETIRLNKALLLYPNPANEYFNLKIPKEYAGVYSFSIADEYGNIIMTKSVSRKKEAFTEVINIKHFQKGVYTLQFFTKDQKLVRKLIKL